MCKIYFPVSDKESLFRYTVKNFVFNKCLKHGSKKVAIIMMVKRCSKIQYSG